MSNMRLNNAVEEALGSSDECRGSGACGGGDGAAFATCFTTHGAAAGLGSRPASLRINHTEDENYGRSQHSD